MAGHTQVISRISKGNQNIFMYNFIVTTFDSQDKGTSAWALTRPGATPPLIVTDKTG